MEERPQSNLGQRLSSAADVIDALGGTKAVADLLAVGQSAVSNYRKLGFPARSHFILSKICAERGLDVADAVFGGYRIDRKEKPAYRPAPAAPGSGLKQLLDAGFEQVSLPILQPAAPFIDRMGPEMQRRLYTFTDPAGEQLCLRPDLTIPTALAYLANRESGRKQYAYQGTAFRYQPRGSGQPEEFTQAGVEIIGGDGGLEDDRTVITTIFNFLRQAGLGRENLRAQITDYDMLSVFLSKLGINEEQQISIKRNIERAKDIDDFSKRMRHQREFRYAGNRANVTIDPQQNFAGRSGEEILRNLEVKRETRESTLPTEIVEKTCDFLRTCERARGMKDIGENYPDVLNWMLSRTSELASEFAPTKAENLPLDRTNFTPGINRSMAYYTGLSFEIYADGLDRPIATGGRYDDLLQALGAHDKMPAVGGAISLERLARAVEMHS